MFTDAAEGDVVVRTLKTESGAVYKYTVVDGMPMIRRVSHDHEKRGDGEWQEMLTPLSAGSLVGYRVVLVMRSLARYGQDDHGTSPEDAEASGVTTRVTTRVVEDSL